MAALNIRNLDEDLKSRLRIVAAQNGHSMEEEARLILKTALAHDDRRGLGTRIHQRFAALAIEKLDIPKRGTKPTFADFSE